eukprot:5820252-Pyramimonas_sp.AAC.2
MSQVACWYAASDLATCARALANTSCLADWYCNAILSELATCSTSFANWVLLAAISESNLMAVGGRGVALASRRA